MNHSERAPIQIFFNHVRPRKTQIYISNWGRSKTDITNLCFCSSVTCLSLTPSPFYPQIHMAAAPEKHQSTSCPDSGPSRAVRCLRRVSQNVPRQKKKKIFIVLSRTSVIAKVVNEKVFLMICSHHLLPPALLLFSFTCKRFRKTDLFFFFKPGTIFVTHFMLSMQLLHHSSSTWSISKFDFPRKKVLD